MNVGVFIQNEAGSNRKHYHDEKTLEWNRVVDVSRPYPYPDGFVVGTTAEDGGNVDCFVITNERLKTGQLVEGQIASLMERFEDVKVGRFQPRKPSPMSRRDSTACHAEH
jgi:inorganic pyrophosphatase